MWQQICGTRSIADPLGTIERMVDTRLGSDFGPALSGDHPESGNDGPISSPLEDMRRRANALLIVSVCLALIAGAFGALWVIERGDDPDNDELAFSEETDNGQTERIDELESQVEERNTEIAALNRELAELRLAIAPVPEGRISELAFGFVPAYVAEAANFIFAVSDAGEWVVIDELSGNEVVREGSLGSSPTGAFALRGQVWVSTEAGPISVLSLDGELPDTVIESVPVGSLVRDGRAFWAVDAESNSLLRYHRTTGMLTNTIQIPVEIRDVTVGAGAVWALGSDGLVYRVNTADLTVAPLEAGFQVVSIAAGPDAVWALSAADGSIRQIDAVSGEVLTTIPVGRDPIDAAFSGTSVWVALRSGSTMVEIDVRTAAISSRTPLDAVPESVTTGRGGVFVSFADSSLPIVRVDALAEEQLDE